MAEKPADTVQEKAPVSEKSIVTAFDVSANGADVEKGPEKVPETGYAGEPIEEGYGPPELSYIGVFLLFLRFGCTAFGGPVQQIAMMKEELVVKGVYQALPGPEATELACYFGLVAKGYFAAFLGGLGFILPGFLIMLLLSYIYGRFNLFNNPGFLASFYGIRPCVPAFALRATIKLSEHCLKDHTIASAPDSELLAAIAVSGMLLTLFHTPFFATLGFLGLVNAVYKNARINNRPGVPPGIAGWLFLLAGLSANIIYLGVTAKPPNAGSLSAGLRTQGNGLGSLFVTGLLAGLVTFGGAFTAVPYVYRSLVVVGGQMTAAQFLDGIAIVNIVPTPLVMFITWDGFMAAGIQGAVLMTIGMFLPCFTFVVVLHRFFMYVTANQYFGSFIDGVSAAVIGIIAETVCQLMKAAIHTGMDAIVFCICAGAIFTYTNKNTPVYVLIASAMAGQIIYDAHSGNFKTYSSTPSAGLGH